MADDKITVLPRVIEGRNMSIVINAPILSDEAFIKHAILVSMEKLGEEIEKDVVTTRPEEFSDKIGDKNFPSGKYKSSYEYYTSGNVPYWSGGLLGSFQYIGSESELSHFLAFTAPYAEAHETGSGSGYPPKEWVEDKLGTKAVPEFTTFTPHPFTATVTLKLNESLESRAYFGTFANVLIDSLK